MPRSETHPYIAIACGGTGGHLFPGLAVAEVLQQNRCDVALLVSPKPVDQEAVKSVSGMEVITLPAIALQKERVVNFARGAWASYRLCLSRFRERIPAAVLAMGGFTSAPPILAGKRLGAATFLHEANAIPGRANRWLARWVDEVFIAFSDATQRLSTPHVIMTGMPVRPQFRAADAGACRMALGFAPDKPVVLVTGGSQGAHAINELVCQALPRLAQDAPETQFLHLTGPNDFEKVRTHYASQRLRAQVLPFLTEMELALGAATLAVSRAGASSLAELAAMQVPAILIPYPVAADNHQFFNAQALVAARAARRVDQASATPESLARMIVELLSNDAERRQMSVAMEKWFVPDAAERIAWHVMKRIGVTESAEAARVHAASSHFSKKTLKQAEACAPAALVVERKLSVANLP